MSMNARRHRSRQRGQVIPIVALSSIALLGATALAVDLGLQTHNARTLQNVTDAAALAGAQDLSANPSAADQYQGAQDALLLIHKRMGWPVFAGSTTNVAWAAAAAAPCALAGLVPGALNGSLNPTCDITVVPPSPNNSYAITIQSPAKTSKTVSHTDLHYFEVTMSQTVRNNFGGAVGEPSSINATRSTAYHFAGNQPFGFALFAKNIINTQNKSTLIYGDVYSDRYVGPQSAGQAGFCTEGGLVVLGYPQAPASYDTKNNPGQFDIQPATANVVNTIATCAGNGFLNNTKAGSVNQTRNPQNGCTVSGVTISGGPNSTVGACVANPSLAGSSPKLQQPSLSNPTQTFCGTQGRSGGVYSPGVYSCSSGSSLSLTGSDTLGAGVYEIRRDKTNTKCSPTSCYDLDISTNANLAGVTIILEQNATMGVHGTGTTVTITPYQPPSPQVPTDGTFSIYAPPGSNAEVWVDNLGANLNLFGTMYLPDGTARARSNAFFNIDGQAIVGTWDDQGGDHPSADITYNGQRNAPQREILSLVE
jgi:hypothetical protein